MTKPIHALQAQIVQLPVADRLALAEQILASLDQADPAVDAAWVREAESRLRGWRQGQVAASTLSDVLAKYGK